MDEHTKTDGGSSDIAKADDALIYQVSDEELEAAAAGPMVTYQTAGGWLSSTPQCCSFGGC